MFQLISSHVDVYRPTTYDRVTRDVVLDMFGGVEYHQIPYVQALMGDSADNIPGVPGIGPKTAGRLICEFGTLDNLMDKVDEVKPPRM